jgi:hypothetical protein
VVPWESAWLLECEPSPCSQYRRSQERFSVLISSKVACHSWKRTLNAINRIPKRKSLQSTIAWLFAESVILTHYSQRSASFGSMRVAWRAGR